MLLDLYKRHNDQAALSGAGFLPTPPRGFGMETIEAGFEAATAPDEFGRTGQYRRKLYDDAVSVYEKRTGDKLVSPSVYETDRARAINDFGISGPGLQAAIDQHRAGVDLTLSVSREKYPDIPDPADFDSVIATESTKRRTRESLLNETATGAGSVGLFLGAMGGEMTHPIQVMTLPFGGVGGGAAKTTIGKMALSAAEQSAIAAGTQAAIEVGDFYSRKSFGTQVSLDEVALNIATAAAGGAILDSLVKSAPVVYGSGARAVAAGGRSVLDRFTRAPRAALDAVNVSESDAFTMAANISRPGDVAKHAQTLNASVSAVDQGQPAPSLGQPMLAPARVRPADASVARKYRVTDASSRFAGQSIVDDGKVFTASGRAVNVEYQVVEARNLITSHGSDMRDNPAFPPELQPRDRTRSSSQTQINEIAARLVPERLAGGSDAATGAPIIGPDNVVESGNGRVLALQQAYRRFPGKALEYRQHLENLGFDAGDLSEPILIRRRVTGMTPEARIAFTREANEAAIMTMGAGEQALSDAKRIPNGIFELYTGGELALVRNRGFVRRVVDALPAGERAAMLTADGELSQGGVKRVEAALLAKAYGDANLISKLTESTENDIRAIGKALAEAAPAWAQMRARAAAGEIAPGMDVTADLLSAVRVIERSRGEATSVGDLLKQGQMFGDGLTEPAYGFLRMMFRDPDMSRPAAQSAVTERLSQFVAEANKTRPGPDMFGNAPVTPGEVLKVAPAHVVDEAPAMAQSAAASETMTASAMDTELARVLDVGDFEVPVEIVEVDGARVVRLRSAKELMAEADGRMSAARQVMNCAIGAVGGR